MFKKKAKTIATKKRNNLAILAVAIIACFIAEHGALALAIHTGVVQGKVVPPTVAFGGYADAQADKLQQLADALPAKAAQATKVATRTQASPPAEKPAVP